MTDSSQTTVLQFGTGRFLRAFAGLFAHELNASAQPASSATRGAAVSIVAVQSTGSGRAEQLRASGGRYHVAVRGLSEGREIDQLIEVASVRRALAARDQWREIVEVARSESLAAIVSNTTEVGYALDPADGPATPVLSRDSLPCPRSFPAKLLAVLAARFEAGRPGVPVLPCELLEQNGLRLRGLVLQQAAEWSLPRPLVEWLDGACTWHNTLVDRIVSAPRAGDPMAAHDPLFAVAEPFALWLVDGSRAAPVFDGHPAVRAVEALRPYHLRKVRILNGAHTALVAKALPLGFETVRQAVLDDRIGVWLRRLLAEEIVPALEGRTEGPGEFAQACLERFANPFLEHRLADIALAHDAKLRTRLVPTWHDYRARFGHPPPLLSQLLPGLV